MKVSEEIILETALKLFNQKGLSAVTARVISDELGISPGSFSYHFPDKSRLVIELYRVMIEEMNSCLSLLKEKKPGIKPFLETFQNCARVQLKYRFFFLHLFEILGNYPAIKQMHKRAIARERILAQQLFKQYITVGVIRKNSTKPDLKHVLRQSEILFSYWIIDAQLRGFNSENETISYYSEVCCSPIKPYLNTKAKNEFEVYFKKNKK